MRKLRLICFCILLLNNLFSQTSDKQIFKVACYNVENFFDCVDDSLTNDSEFLPGGIRGWNYTKYQKKQANIAKVIAAMGGWATTTLVGLCESSSESVFFYFLRYQRPTIYPSMQKRGRVISKTC